MSSQKCDSILLPWKLCRIIVHFQFERKWENFIRHQRQQLHEWEEMKISVDNRFDKAWRKMWNYLQKSLNFNLNKRKFSHMLEWGGGGSSWNWQISTRKYKKTLSTVLRRINFEFRHISSLWTSSLMWYFQHSGQLHSHKIAANSPPIFTMNFRIFIVPSSRYWKTSHVNHLSIINTERATFELTFLSFANEQTSEVHGVWALDGAANSISADFRSSCLPMWKWIDSVAHKKMPKSTLLLPCTAIVECQKILDSSFNRRSPPATIEKLHKLKCKMHGSTLPPYSLFLSRAGNKLPVGKNKKSFYEVSENLLTERF